MILQVTCTLAGFVFELPFLGLFFFLQDFCPLVLLLNESIVSPERRPRGYRCCWDPALLLAYVTQLLPAALLGTDCYFLGLLLLLFFCPRLSSVSSSFIRKRTYKKNSDMFRV